MPEDEDIYEEIRRKSEHPRNFQDENGVDLSLIDYMLSLTPTQRLEALEKEMADDDALTRARVKFYGSDPRDTAEAEQRKG